MRVGWLELLRRPGRFVATGVALALLTVLLIVLGGFLDGLFLRSTGALRAAPGELVSFSSLARTSLFRSELGQDQLQRIEQTRGVKRVSGLGISPVNAEGPGSDEPGSDEPVGVAVVGYERAGNGVGPPLSSGQAYADRRLAEEGVELGDELLVGRGDEPVAIAEWVSDTAFQLQPTLWVAPATWRSITAASAPGGSPPFFQVAAVDLAAGAEPDAVAARIDAPGDTETVTRQEAVLALPGVEQQRTTLQGVIGVAFVVAGLVVALFFVLLTLERTRLYAVLKALGTATPRLFAGLAVQAVVITVGAFAAGAAAAAGLLALVPAGVPVVVLLGRVAVIGGGLVATALVGSAVSLRRVARIEPAEAIG